jgi:hypothetical protein
MKKIIMMAIAICLLASPSVVHAKPSPNIKCVKYLDIIQMVSDSMDMMYDVDYIMWRESRCNASAINKQDPNGGSLGLFQINKFWCKPNRYSKRGFLQQAGVLTKCAELYNPIVSANAMMAIYDYANDRYGDGWGPWGGEPKWN